MATRNEDEGGSRLWRGMRSLLFGVGPRDVTTGDALGGNFLFTSTAEQRFPLGLPEELRMFGRVFVDAGTLTDLDVSGEEIADSGNLRLSGGVGLSWLSPLGPIAIDLSNAFIKESEDETEFFRISFGTRF